MNYATRTTRPIFFHDTSGGALAALAAGVARSLGYVGARAVTAADAISIPSEIPAVLAEIGAAVPPVERLSPKEDGDAQAEHVDVERLSLVLYAGTSEFECLALARIARDRLERRLEQEFSG